MEGWWAYSTLLMHKRAPYSTKKTLTLPYDLKPKNTLKPSRLVICAFVVFLLLNKSSELAIQIRQNEEFTQSTT
jgi:hypothetical protein